MPTTGSSSSERRRWEKPEALRAREGIDRATLRAWVDKGVLERAQLAPRTAVRVRYAEEEEER
jgi:hypothetical protein